jgi:hypothetical protein
MFRHAAVSSWFSVVLFGVIMFSYSPSIAKDTDSNTSQALSLPEIEEQPERKGSDYTSIGIVLLSVGATLVASSSHFCYRSRTDLISQIAKHDGFLSSSNLCVKADGRTYTDSAEDFNDLASLQTEMDKELKLIADTEKVIIENHNNYINKLIGGLS